LPPVPPPILLISSQLLLGAPARGKDALGHQKGPGRVLGAAAGGEEVGLVRGPGQRLHGGRVPSEDRPGGVHPMHVTGTPQKNPGKGWSDRHSKPITPNSKEFEQFTLPRRIEADLGCNTGALQKMALLGMVGKFHFSLMRRGRTAARGCRCRRWPAVCRPGPNSARRPGVEKNANNSGGKTYGKIYNCASGKSNCL